MEFFLMAETWQKYNFEGLSWKIGLYLTVCSYTMSLPKVTTCSQGDKMSKHWLLTSNQQRWMDIWSEGACDQRHMFWKGLYCTDTKIGGGLQMQYRSHWHWHSLATRPLFSCDFHANSGPCKEDLPTEYRMCISLFIH